MNKIIPFSKDITFNEKIGEIVSIALDDTLTFTDNYTIKGELVVRGCNKNDDIETDFNYPLPVEITVDDRYDTDKCTIMIDDFYYEIINDNILHVKIDILLDNLFYKEIKEEKEIREVSVEVEKIKDEIKEDVLSIEPSKESEENSTIDLFQNNGNKEYSIYRVYTVRENDTLNSILEKYKVTKEELEELNDLKEFKVGIKLIIPSIDE